MHAWIILFWVPHKFKAHYCDLNGGEDGHEERAKNCSEMTKLLAANCLSRILWVGRMRREEIPVS